MNHTVVTYLAFVVAVLIIMWAVVEMSRRYSRTHRHSSTRNTPSTSPDQWATLKTTLPDSDEPVPDITEDTTDTHNSLPSEAQTRAKQNGHYSQSKHPH